MALETKSKSTIANLLLGALSIIGGVSIGVYLENTYRIESASSILIIVFSAMLYIAWKKVPKKECRRYYLANSIYAVAFSFFMVYGQRLDYNESAKFKTVLLLGLGISTAAIPIMLLLGKLLEQMGGRTCSFNNHARIASISIVVFFWVLGYLAAFPGIYSTDAPMWFLEFDDSTVPVSSQWSPAYAWLFHFFVSFGHKSFGSYEAGLAIFTAIQTIFLLFIAWRIISYVHEICGSYAAVLTGLFLGIVPTHIVMAVQTVQGAPFMGCFAMVMIHLCKMTIGPEEYWADKRNALGLIIWSIAACVLRNNAYYALVIFLAFIPLYSKKYKAKLFGSIVVVLLIVTIYKGPLLDAFGVQKGSALREMLSMPLQQMACVYEEYPEKITKEQKSQIEQYVDADALSLYKIRPSISDPLKEKLNDDLVQKNMGRFLRLYITLGIRAPAGYIKAAYVQNLGLLYIDKSYPDPRTYHPYLHYASYDSIIKSINEKYIVIGRHSLIPVYNNVLGRLFGYSKEGYAGEAINRFDDIPVLSVACRASTYFWLLLYLVVVGIVYRKKECFIPLGLLLSFSFTILIGPLIMYRYYAPVIYAMPIIIAFVVKYVYKAELV